MFVSTHHTVWKIKNFTATHILHEIKFKKFRASKTVLRFCLYITLWKFHDFSVTQILREINFEYSRSAKSAISTNLEALKLDFYEFLHFLSMKFTK